MCFFTFEASMFEASMFEAPMSTPEAPRIAPGVSTFAPGVPTFVPETSMLPIVSRMPQLPLATTGDNATLRCGGPYPAGDDTDKSGGPCATNEEAMSPPRMLPRPPLPSVFGRNLQCQLVREVDTREECHWSHACKGFKRTCVGSNGILECKLLLVNAHRATATDAATAAT
jgi:hypothetical protein